MKPAARRPRPILLMMLAVSAAYASDATWDSIIRLTTDPASQVLGYGRQRGIAADDSGNLHVAWLDSRTVPYEIWYRRFDHQSGNWMPEQRLTYQPVNCQYPSIACDNGGNVHVAWHMEDWPCHGIWYKRYDAGRQAWLPDTLLDSPPSGRFHYHPSIACTRSSGAVHVAWYGQPDTGMFRHAFHKEFAPGTGWDSATQVSEAPCMHEAVSVAVDAEDNLCVVWKGWDFGGEFSHVCCRRRAGGIWQSVEIVSDFGPALSQYDPSLAADDAGNFHFTWHGRALMGIYQRVFYRIRRPAGWSSIDTVSPRVNYQQESPCVSARGTGEARVVWRGQTASSPSRFQLLYRSRSGSGDWSAQEQLTSRASADATNPSLACGSDSGVHVVWHDNSSGNLDVYWLHGFQALSVAERGDFLPRAASLFASLLPGSGRDLCRELGCGRLFDASGRLIGSLPAPMPARLAPGVYFLTAGPGNAVPTARLVVPR